MLPSYSCLVALGIISQPGKGELEEAHPLLICLPLHAGVKIFPQDT